MRPLRHGQTATVADANRPDERASRIASAARVKPFPGCSGQASTMRFLRSSMDSNRASIAGRPAEIVDQESGKAVFAYRETVAVVTPGRDTTLSEGIESRLAPLRRERMRSPFDFSLFAKRSLQPLADQARPENLAKYIPPALSWRQSATKSRGTMGVVSRRLAAVGLAVAGTVILGCLPPPATERPIASSRGTMWRPAPHQHVIRDIGEHAHGLPVVLPGIARNADTSVHRGDQ